MSIECRIVKRIRVSGKDHFIIQYKNFWTFGKWSDCYIGGLGCDSGLAIYDTLDKAMERLHIFDSSTAEYIPVWPPGELRKYSIEMERREGESPNDYLQRLLVYIKEKAGVNEGEEKS